MKDGRWKYCQLGSMINKLVSLEISFETDGIFNFFDCFAIMFNRAKPIQEKRFCCNECVLWTWFANCTWPQSWVNSEFNVKAIWVMLVVVSPYYANEVVLTATLEIIKFQRFKAFPIIKISRALNSFSEYSPRWLSSCNFFLFGMGRPQGAAVL